MKTGSPESGELGRFGERGPSGWVSTRGHSGFCIRAIPFRKPMHFSVEHLVRKHCIWAWNSSVTVSGALRAAVTSASTHSPEAQIILRDHTANVDGTLS